MTEHSIFPPSGAKRGIRCPASVMLQGITTPNEFMAEGTVCHIMSEKHLSNGATLQGYLNQKMLVDGFDIKITQELIDIAEFYCSEVKQLISATYPDSEVGIEQRVNLESYGSNYAQVFGTADCIIDDVFNTLVIIDLKSGKGKSVPADAEQLKLYAVMAAGDMLRSYERITTVVIQPRDPYGEHIKIADHDPADLERWVLEEVLPAIDDALSENPTFNPSYEACQWCNYKGRCKAQAEFAFALMSDSPDIDFENTNFISSTEISDRTLSTVLGNLGLIESWISDIKKVAVDRLLQGHEIQNYKLVERITRRRWNPDIDIDFILRKELKLKKKDLYEEKLKSPNAVLEMVKKKEKIYERVQELIVKPEGNLTFAHVSDRRTPQEYHRPTGEEDFADV